jgi:hypothetical protein
MKMAAAVMMNRHDRMPNEDLKHFLSSIPTYEDGIFVSKGREVKKKFVDVIKKHFGAVVYK